MMGLVYVMVGTVGVMVALGLGFLFVGWSTDTLLNYLDDRDDRRKHRYTRGA